MIPVTKIFAILFVMVSQTQTLSPENYFRSAQTYAANERLTLFGIHVNSMTYNETGNSQITTRYFANSFFGSDSALQTFLYRNRLNDAYLFYPVTNKWVKVTQRPDILVAADSSKTLRGFISTMTEVKEIETELGGSKKPAAVKK